MATQSRGHGTQDGAEESPPQFQRSECPRVPTSSCATSCEASCSREARPPSARCRASARRSRGCSPTTPHRADSSPVRTRSSPASSSASSWGRTRCRRRSAAAAWGYPGPRQQKRRDGGDQGRFAEAGQGGCPPSRPLPARNDAVAEAEASERRSDARRRRLQGGPLSRPRIHPRPDALSPRPARRAAVGSADGPALRRNLLGARTCPLAGAHSSRYEAVEHGNRTTTRRCSIWGWPS